jgi:hypothetical protein
VCANRNGGLRSSSRLGFHGAWFASATVVAFQRWEEAVKIPKRALRAVVLAGLLARPAYAQSGDVAVAQALFDQARRLMAAGNYAEACPQLEESQKLDPALGTVLNLADCYEQQGRIASAWSHFLEAQGMARGTGHLDAEDVARDRAALLATRLSNLIIEVEKSAAATGLRVTRDDAVVGNAQWGMALPTDPGMHVLRATAPGKKSWETTVRLEGDNATATVRIPVLESDATAALASMAVALPENEPPAPLADRTPTPEPWRGTRTAAVVLAGAGVVAGAVTVVEWIRFENKKSDAQSLCPSPTMCMPANVETALADRGDEKTARAIGIGASVVGVASLAGGAILWFWPAKENKGSAIRVTPMVGSTMGVRAGGTW